MARRMPKSDARWQFWLGKHVSFIGCRLPGLYLFLSWSKGSQMIFWWCVWPMRTVSTYVVRYAKTCPR